MYKQYFVEERLYPPRVSRFLFYHRLITGVFSADGAELVIFSDHCAYTNTMVHADHFARLFCLVVVVVSSEKSRIVRIFYNLLDTGLLYLLNKYTSYIKKIEFI